MMEKIRFYLVRLPIIAITIFFFCCVIAALIYPGSHKEIIGYQSDYYSFTHNFLSNSYVIGYVAFCIVLFIYLRIIFFGPQIGPGKIYSKVDLMLQVIAQKSIVLTFMAAILHQVYGFNLLLKKR